jgi:hypothetical protein
MAKSTKKSVTRPNTSSAKYGRSSLVRVVPVAEAKAEAEAREEAAQLAEGDVAETAQVAEAPVPAAPKKAVVVPATPKRAAPALNVPTKAAAKNAVAAQSAAQAAQAVRRGKATVRGANATPARAGVRAENYGYVVKDLRFIAFMALAVVIIMIILRIVIKS